MVGIYASLPYPRVYHGGYILFLPYHPVHPWVYPPYYRTLLYTARSRYGTRLPAGRALGSEKEKPVGSRPLPVLKWLILLGLMGPSAQDYSVSQGITDERSDRRRVILHVIPYVRAMLRRGVPPSGHPIVVCGEERLAVLSATFVRVNISNAGYGPPVSHPINNVNVPFTPLRRQLSHHQPGSVKRAESSPRFNTGGER